MKEITYLKDGDHTIYKTCNNSEYIVCNVKGTLKAFRNYTTRGLLPEMKEKIKTI